MHFFKGVDMKEGGSEKKIKKLLKCLSRPKC